MVSQDADFFDVTDTKWISQNASEAHQSFSKCMSEKIKDTQKSHLLFQLQLNVVYFYYYHTS